MKRAFFLLLCSLLFAHGASLSIESRITDYELANGLRVVIYVDSSAPVVATHVWYRVGGYHEPIGKTGISHMTEHMSFKQSPAWEPDDFHGLIRRHGGRSSGFTSTWYTGYFAVFAADRWELALELEAARMHGCVFTNEDFLPEKEVVTEEWRLRDNRATSRLWTDFDAAAFQANPQRNPVIGWPDDIRNYTRSAVEEWYRTWYNPANAILVIAGDVRPDKVKPLVARHFDRLKGRPVPVADFYDIEPDQRGERRVEVRMRTTAPSLLVGYRMPGRRDTTDYHAAAVAAAVLGQGRLSRLHRRLVVETGLATSVSSWPRAQSDPGLLVISVTPADAESIPAIEQLIADEVARLGREPVAERELERVRNALAADAVFDRDDAHRVGRLIAMYWTTTGDWREYDRELERTRGIGANEVMAFARNWLRPEFRTIGTLLPARDLLPRTVERSKDETDG
ncbi:MAG TPA: insulinase family protein [candidate division WOR-3 bacterium]|uniref:Insulinase family protein n=1 Tax=candidate division WOR-3 bacterium TaxID=2052148 RepID=A0A7V0T6D0_UNCW3|nr:insulinase family protein [candidate division WOR-3 bacterium]